MEFKIKSLDNEFRVKSMNAIEVLALRNVIDFEDFDTTVKVFKLALERIEVKFDDKWYAVKEKDRDIYYPADIENNVEAVNELIRYFIYDYLRPIFPKSDASKK